MNAKWINAALHTTLLRTSRIAHIILSPIRSICKHYCIH